MSPFQWRFSHNAVCSLNQNDHDRQNKDTEFRYAIATELNNVGVSLYEHEEYSEAMKLYKDAVKMTMGSIQHDQLELGLSSCETFIQNIVHAKEKLHHIVDSPINSKGKTGTTADMLGFFHMTDSVQPSDQPTRCLCDAFKISTTTIKDNIKSVSAITCFNIALVSYKNGLFNEALQVYEKAVMFGCQSSQLLLLAAAFNNMGQIHYKRGALDRAMHNFHQALKLSQKECRRVSQSETTKVNQYIAIIMSNMGRVYFVMGQDDEALSICLDASVAQRAALQKNHIDVAILTFNIGLIQFRRGKIDECMEMYKRFMAHVMSISSKDNPFSSKNNAVSFGISLNDIGQTYEHLGMIEEAEECYKKALELGKAHIHTHKIFSIITYNIGMLMYQKEEYDESLKFLNVSIEILQILLGYNHPDIAAMMYDIGIVLKETGKLTEALSAFVKTCNLQRTLFGNNHHQVAEALLQIGKIHNEMEEYEKAMQAFQETLEILKLVFGRNHPSVAVTLYMMGQIYHLRGDLDNALNVFFEALSIVQADNSSEPVSSKRIITYIGKVHLEKGDVEGALSFFTMAGGAQVSLLKKALAA